MQGKSVLTAQRHLVLKPNLQRNPAVGVHRKAFLSTAHLRLAHEA
ncbi:Uncharacterised protein [Vibrio cholerae]|nr:Uncharacterised protein [Vibrio cholerae]